MSPPGPALHERSLESYESLPYEMGPGHLTEKMLLLLRETEVNPSSPNPRGSPAYSANNRQWSERLPRGRRVWHHLLRMAWQSATHTMGGHVPRKRGATFVGQQHRHLMPIPARKLPAPSASVQVQASISRYKGAHNNGSRISSQCHHRKRRIG